MKFNYILFAAIFYNSGFNVQKIKKWLLVSVFLTVGNSLLYGQQNRALSTIDLEKTYSEYTNLPREVVYVHLNKGLYIKGEALAFSAYVFVKKNKLPSESTTTLYCEILDSNKNRVEVKMLRVLNGQVSNQFDISENYPSGSYTFRAYTSWLKNFPEENNHFETSFTVVDPEEVKSNYEEGTESSIDAQFLPEGGHLVEGVINTVGVVIKDQRGFGVKNIEGIILENNIKISDFKTNHLGLGRLNIQPRLNATYKAIVISENNPYEFSFPKVESKGVALSVSSIKNDVIVQLKTNQLTFTQLEGKEYKIMFHNGSSSIVQPVVMKNMESIFKINSKELSEGIQIITVFNEENKLVLERLFFNYKNFSKLNLETASVKKDQDSLKFILRFEQFQNDSITNGNVSVSTLPQSTKSYTENEGIYAQVYLKPYLRGVVEQAPYYFKNLNRKKKSELDDLLLTQGWSSYNWDAIFEGPPIIDYPFETGMSAQVTIQKKRQRKFMIHLMRYSKMGFIEIEKDKETFDVNGLFPVEDEKFTISYMPKSGKLKSTSVIPNFSPQEIPVFHKQMKTLNSISPVQKMTFEPFYFDSEVLDTIVIDVDAIRKKNIKDKSRGRVDYFDNFKRSSILLVPYLNSYGYTTSYYNGEFKLTDTRRSSNGPPVIVIDGAIYRDISILQNFTFGKVDYVEVFRNGIGAPGFSRPGDGDIIKIFTDPKFGRGTMADQESAYDFPIHFSKPKEFYTPKYSIINSDFYNDYGVLDWKGNLSLDKTGTVRFTTTYNGSTNFKLIVEGTTKSGRLIHEVIDINLE
ncbi:hypothetical protein F0365_00930 [Nonlabens sp. Ci31]|jgi:hypothetical protein|uniref:hypothetical protein n=1 Tax=Nonlabens sp. Ci31 TaxID=2608253 RepID=UPI0014632524|nr:hypothetical protein [Nonlabens sp. Ci31]QJP33078.1 hypothetical protein F0365_00930 [Nonlabens sp. Ci31]